MLRHQEKFKKKKFETYPEDKVEEKKQVLHTLHSSLHSALNLDSEKDKTTALDTEATNLSTKRH